LLQLSPGLGRLLARLGEDVLAVVEEIRVAVVGTAYSRPWYMAVSTAGLRKSPSGNWLCGSGMIQPFEANSAVQMTSMSMTSYRSLFA
jgi:hypothetical protein